MTSNPIKDKDKLPQIQWNIKKNDCKIQYKIKKNSSNPNERWTKLTPSPIKDKEK